MAKKRPLFPEGEGGGVPLLRNDRGDIQEGDFLTYGVFQRVAPPLTPS